MSADDPLPHYRLMRELAQAWREARRAKLAEHGIAIRRPRTGWPDAPEPPTARDWHGALAELAALRLYEEGGDVAETVREVLDDYLVDAEPELAAELFALDVDELTVDTALKYLELLN